MANLTTQYLKIADTARNISNPAAYLATGTDPAVIAGYTAQREILLDQLVSDVAVGGLEWGTADEGSLYMFKPFSRGHVAINSTDPLASPVVDFRAATDPTDLDVAAALVGKARDVMDAPSMRALGPAELSPFAAAVRADDEVKRAIRQAMNPTNGHECCTAAMMPRELGGVVDDRLRVYGVQGLRVADISFWPMPVVGAPSATIYAAAEKVCVKGGGYLQALPKCPFADNFHAILPSSRILSRQPTHRLSKSVIQFKAGYVLLGNVVFAHYIYINQRTNIYKSLIFLSALVPSRTSVTSLLILTSSGWRLHQLDRSSHSVSEHVVDFTSP